MKVPGPGTEGQAPHGAQHPSGQAAWGMPPTGTPGGYDGYGAQQPSTGGSGLAITALVLGVVSLLLCWVPIVNNLFAVTAIVAVVLGLVAARRAKKGRSTGRGVARAGWILGVIALVGVVATQAFYAAVLDSVGDEIEQSVEESQDELDGESAVSEDDAEQQAAAEEADAVHAIGDVAQVGDYEVSVTGLDLEGDAAIAAANAFNEPPTGRYVLATLAVTYVGDDEGTPWVDLSTTFVGSDARHYDETSCMAVVPNEGFDLPTLTSGGQATFDVCFDVALDGLGDPQVYVEESFSFDGAREYWAD